MSMHDFLGIAAVITYWGFVNLIATIIVRRK